MWAGILTVRDAVHRSAKLAVCNCVGVGGKAGFLDLLLPNYFLGLAVIDLPIVAQGDLTDERLR